MYLNKAYIIGNLTREPELKALPSGIKVCSFSVATNRSFKDKDGQRKDVADFHNIVAFGKLGELSAQYLKKGQQALVEGRIQTRTWETNGEKKYRTEIIADNIQFGFRGTGGASAGGSSTVSAGGSASDVGGASKDGGAGEASDAGAPTGDKDKIDYPQEEINPDDIPF